ncbi:luciferin 4-monooxygenase isoform X2 [Anabrus simplex]
MKKSLTAYGIRSGDVIAISSENNIEYPWVLLGSLAAGASCILLNPAYTPRELEHALEISQPRIVLCSASVGKCNQQGQTPSIDAFFKIDCIQDVIVWGSQDKNLPNVCKRLEDIINHTVEIESKQYPENQKSSESSSINCDAVKSGESHIALILSSSGSTGLPKGVTLTHTNVVAALTTSGSYASREDIALGLMPFFHAYGLVLMLMCLCEGAKVVVMNKFAVDVFVSTIKKYQITSLYLVPSLLALISKRDLITDEIFRSVRQVWTGAASVNPDIQKIVNEKLAGHGHLHHSYGLTETTFTVFTGLYRLDKSGSPGKLTPGLECKVINPNTKQLCGPNEIGELCFRGPLLMAGYMKNSEATSEAIDFEGWLHSGDLGYYDNDSYFFIVDRLKEMIKYQGYQVSPTELESILLTHSAIQDAAVIGIPDDVFGELPQAFIVKQPGIEISREEIMEFVAKRVSPHKRLHGGVKFVDFIPKTVSGKIQRRELRKYKDI